MLPGKYGMTYSQMFAGIPVLVTGANGFIGSHLARKLLREGARVHVLVRINSNTRRIQDIAEEIAFCYGEVTDYTSIAECINTVKPQIIFHLAANRNIKRDIGLLDAMIDTNIKGTLNLVRAAVELKAPLKCFVNTGSSEEYGDGQTPFVEVQRETPVSPYSASKVASTYFCQMLHKSMGLPIVTLRPFLTYGPDQDSDMFIPSLIRHCLEKRDFPMTEGNQTRDFVYIDDVVDAYMSAAVSPEAIGRVMNIGNGVEYSIKDVAGKIVQMMGNPVRLFIGALQKRPGEAERFFCDNAEARQVLNWHPGVGLDEGLSKTIQWFSKIHIEMKDCLY